MTFQRNFDHVQSGICLFMHDCMTKQLRLCFFCFMVRLRDGFFYVWQYNWKNVICTCLLWILFSVYSYNVVLSNLNQVTLCTATRMRWFQFEEVQPWDISSTRLVMEFDACLVSLVSSDNSPISWSCIGLSMPRHNYHNYWILKKVPWERNIISCFPGPQKFQIIFWKMGN